MERKSAIRERRASGSGVASSGCVTGKCAVGPTESSITFSTRSRPAPRIATTPSGSCARSLSSSAGIAQQEVNPKKVSYEDIRENYLARAVERGLASLKKVGKELQSLDTMTRLDAFFGGWKAAEITQADIRRFRAQGKDEASRTSDK